MQGQLIIEGGPTVELEGVPAQGTRHAVAFGVLGETGEQVAVKLECLPGALGRERAALAGLGAREGPVPRLLASGAALLGAERVECLVTERRPGAPPAEIDGWRRMGRAHARVTSRGGQAPAGLPRFGRVAFGREHARRIRELGERLAPLAVSIPDWALLSSERVPGTPPLVITHGDPGPGNFLDDGAEGSIIDWEEAQVAPRGIDLARLVVIAMLGAGPSGYRAHDHAARAAVVTAGYLEGLSDSWRPSDGEWRWWLAAAGIQFIHRRWQLGGRPAPWQDAADVLLAMLTGQPRPT
jgi:Phosphotransferase enzyme family